jgi:hypothetical protein
MRHARSVLLAATRAEPIKADEIELDEKICVKDLREWERLGAWCGGCGHQAWLDRRDLDRRFRAVALVDLQAKLRCLRCDNRTGNRLILGNLPRD